MPTSFGFLNLAHLNADRVVNVGVNRIFEAVRMSAEEHSRVSQELLSILARPTMAVQEQYELAGTGTLQPLDVTGDGNPAPVKVGGHYTVGYPLFGGGYAWGTNRVSRQLMTVEEANKATWEAQRQDADWLVRHAAAALFDNVAWVFNDQIGGGQGSAGLGNITVQPLANADAVVYPRRGVAAAAIDNHYLAQAAAIADATNPFPGIAQELKEHPGNSGPYVAYINPADSAAVGGLTEFVEVDDTEIVYGAAADTLPSAPAAVLGPGDEVLGRLRSSNIWVVEWSVIPANYICTIAMGAEPPLAMRQMPIPALHGLFPEAQDVDGNHWVSRMIRYAGFGVKNRVSAVIQRVGNGAYAIPAGFDAPLAA